MPKFMRPEDYEMMNEVNNPKPKFMRPEDYEMKAEVERIENSRETMAYNDIIKEEKTKEFKGYKDLDPTAVIEEAKFKGYNFT